MDGEISQRLKVLTDRQHGVVTTDQAMTCGLTADAIAWRVAAGRWRRLGQGLYQLSTQEPSWLTRASAAVLRGGKGVALTLDSAGYLLGLVTKAPAVISLAVPRPRQVVRLPGSRVRRRARIVSVERRGLPVTTGAFTTIDLAGREATWRSAVAVCADATRTNVVTPDELAEELAARGRHPHRRVLVAAFGVLDEGAQSGLEVDFVRTVVLAHGLPTVTLQRPDQCAGRTVRRDAVFEEFKVIVELDGRLGHEGAGLWHDRRRDRKAARDGWLTIRAGWADVVGDPCELADDVASTLSGRGWTGWALSCSRGCLVGTNKR